MKNYLPPASVRLSASLHRSRANERRGPDQTCRARLIAGGTKFRYSAGGITIAQLGLADGYLANGDKELAITNYKKSLK